jgi:uncharacterized protein (TIGR00369 family)
MPHVSPAEAAIPVQAGFARVMDVVFPGDTNHHGTLFGGIGLALLDKAAFIAAVRHGRRDFVTASSEEIDFIAPARLGDIVQAEGKVTRVGRRSLSVDTTLTAENPTTGIQVICAKGRFNMVDVGAGGVALPPLPDDVQPSETSTLFSDLVFPDRTSHYGSLYGGHALAAMAKAAFIIASRQSRKKVVLASCRQADFTQQVAAGELMDVVARIGSAGRSSMVVDVELWAASPTSESRSIRGSGQYVMVAIG